MCCRQRDGATARRSTAVTRTPRSRTDAHRLLAESDATDGIAGVIRALQRSGDERSEQRMRPSGPRPELRVRLRPHEERMHLARKLGELHEPAVRRRTREDETGILER